MTTTKRSAARTAGLRLAAKVATVSGFAVAALGLVEARAASASAPSMSRGAASAVSVSSVSSDDAQPVPEEAWLKAAKGGCGCAPCWGPPAPPAARSASRGRRRTSKTSRRSTRTARRPSGGAR